MVPPALGLSGLSRDLEFLEPASSHLSDSASCEEGWPEAAAARGLTFLSLFLCSADSLMHWSKHGEVSHRFPKGPATSWAFSSAPPNHFPLQEVKN